MSVFEPFAVAVAGGASPLTLTPESRANRKLASLGDFGGKALLELTEQALDAGEFTESSRCVGLMDSEALILASIYPDRQLRFPDS
jgi:hypothetical protein